MKKSRNKSSVYLIGAGPGDPELLTIKASKIIAEADVIIYDNLVNHEILRLAKSGCEKIYVGKQASDHTLTQDKINSLIVEKANNSMIIARLKGGDPFVFGRGGEEADFLNKNGISFQIIPGITSAIAAPAYAGIPVTDRRYSSSFTVITGHEDPNKLESSINWEALARLNSTLIILMGVKNLKTIVSELLKFGRSEKEPAAMIHWGTKPQQKVVQGNLSNIVEKVEKASLKPPSILVIGDVVACRDQIKWYEMLPLFGKNIIITRPKDELIEFKSILNSYGANIIELAAINIEPLESYNHIDSELKNISHYDWIILTSKNGVKFLFERIASLGKDSRLLGNIKIAAIGSATENELMKYNIKADLVPQKYVSEEIAKELSSLNEIKGNNFLLLRADKARKDIDDILIGHGATVKSLDLYKILLNYSIKDSLFEALDTNEIDAITFTSASTVQSFYDLIDEKHLNSIKMNTKIFSIGPITSKKSLELFGKIDYEAKVYNIDGLTACILDNLSN